MATEDSFYRAGARLVLVSRGGTGGTRSGLFGAGGPQPSLSRSRTARGRLLVLTFDFGPVPSRVIVPLAVSVQRLAREGEVCLAECFALRGVGVDQGSDILGERIPVGDQLRL